MVATIQLEMAERLRAGPEDEAYGALSVLVQSVADVQVVRVLPPSVFWPRPKVDSAVVSIVPDPARRAAVGDLGWFHTVVRQVFLHRRKNLRRVLYSLWRDRWTKPEVDAMLEGLGLTGLVRAEAMNVEEFRSLADALRERFKAMEPEPEPETEPEPEPGPPDE
jgi:16S rRNA (adenine1518-N6/adenine1519-N6)-dimethyltransferase